MVVSDDRALEFLGKVGLLVEAFATAKHSDTFRAVFAGNSLQAPGEEFPWQSHPFNIEIVSFPSNILSLVVGGVISSPQQF